MPSAFSDPVSAGRDPCAQEPVGAESLAGISCLLCVQLSLWGSLKPGLMQIKVKSKRHRNHLSFQNMLPQHLIVAEHLAVSSTKEVLKYILNIFFHSIAFNENSRNKVT